MAIMMLEWVFTSIFLILVVLSLRAALGKRMSAGLRYALWAVVLVRLLVPVQLFTSPVAGTWAVTEKQTEHQITDWPTVSAAPVNAPGDSALGLPLKNTVSGNVPAPPALPDTPTAPDAPEPPDLSDPPEWLAALGWVWLAGSAAVALVFLLSNLRFYWKLRRERLPLETADCPLRAYVVTGLPSPCLFGIFQPAVYVTPEAAADPDMLRHVLAHEHTHYRHGDHIWSLLRCTALAVHWWDPLVWVSAVLSQRDAELACDEGALKRLGDGERAGYGNTLLALVTAKPRPGDLFRCATTMAGDKKSLKERISRIAIAPKRVLWAVVVAVLVTSLACVCAFGQAAEPEDGLPIVSATGSRTELAFSLAERACGSYVVKMKGTVEGFALEEETLWYPPGDWSTRGELSMKISLEDCIKFLYVKAEWKDDGRTAMEISVQHVGTKGGSAWVTTITFTVTQSEEGWTVTEMEGQLPRLSDDRPKRRITDEEAVTLARIAAKLLTEAEDYYNGLTSQPEDWDDLSAHFTVDVEGVPEDVIHFVGRAVREQYDDYRDHLEANPLTEEPIEFDGWRVQALNGPWQGTVQDMDVEVWQINYEFHTTTQELALNLVNGGAYLDEDGWLCPTYPNCTYVIFLANEGGKLGYLTSVMINDCSPENPSGIFYETVAMELARKGLTNPVYLQADLNRNGVPEELRVVSIDGGAGQRLEVWENDKLIFSEEGFNTHAGWTSLFLRRGANGDYLLRYHPTMYGGVCDYSYQLFTLENDRETVVLENSLEFDINFQPWLHQSFDPEAIANYVGDVNSLLTHSVQLLNTDENLLGTFEKNGQLYDDLWFMDTMEGDFARNPSKSLLENLKAYQAAMEDLWDNPWDDPWGLCLTTSLATPTSVNIAFTQTGGEPTGELQYGSRYWLLREDEGDWVEVPDILDPNVNLAWTDEAYTIPMSGQCVEEVNWSWLYGELPPGHYCICKDVTDWRAPGDFDIQTYYAQFFVD